MASKTNLDKQLDELGAIDDPISDETQELYRRLLKRGLNLPVAKVARLIMQHNLHDLLPELATAFDRFAANGSRTDSGCRAKEQIIETLTSLDYRDPDIFLKAVYHIQMEPVFGGRVDTAANLRANSIMGLSNSRYRDIHLVLCDLLADKELAPRRAAVQTLGQLNSREADVLLRYKLRLGDESAELMGDLFTALLDINLRQNLHLVSEVLQCSDLLLVEAAALSLGSTKNKAALQELLQFWDENILPQKREILLLPIALTRTQESLDFLLDIVCQGGPMAIHTLKALAIYKGDHRRQKQIAEAVADSHDSGARSSYKTIFD